MGSRNSALEETVGRKDRARQDFPPRMKVSPLTSTSLVDFFSDAVVTSLMEKGATNFDISLEIIPRQMCCIQL